MPELPEVETIRCNLESYLVGQRIVSFSAIFPPSLVGKEATLAALPALFAQNVINAVTRRGKLLLISFGIPQTNLYLAFHLKMTGNLLIKKGPPPQNNDIAHARLSFTLSNNLLLFFNDIRKFGYCRAMKPAELAEWPFWQTLGPEPLEISYDEFCRLFYTSTGKPLQVKIKNALLNQKTIAGIGNIYADEALFRAKINPCLPAGSLSAKRLGALHQSIVEVLGEGIAAGGSSIRDYRNAEGVSGSFQNSFNVYGRGGKPCMLCKETLTRISLSGRSTVFCPSCQPL